MAETIYGDGETPASGDVADGVAYSLGTRFTPSVAGTATHARWFFPATAPDTGAPGGAASVVGGVFRNSDSLLLGSVTFGTPVLNAWNEAAYASPVPLEAGVAYTAVIWTPNRYVFRGSYVWPVVTASLTTDAVSAGRFASSASITFPGGGFANQTYYADLRFEPESDDPEAAPSGIAVPVSLGSPTVAVGLSAVPDGLAAAVALGSPTVALGLSAVPAGLSVAVGLGSPTIGETTPAPVVPTGFAVEVSLGAPSVAGGPSARRAGGWESFGNALRFNADEARREAETPPVDCPNDGEPLQLVRGVWWCRADGWQWPAKRVVSPLE